MGASFAGTLSQITTPEAWVKNDRATKLRRLFGLYRSQDCWAVARRFRQIDDGNGYVSFEELQQMLPFPEFHLLFIWDVFSQQNELIDSKELLTAVCIFSSARLEEKGRYLVTLFDSTQTGRCTGKELAGLCVVVLAVLAKCTGSVVKAKEVTPALKREFGHLVPEFEERVLAVGREHAWQTARIVGQGELDKILPTIMAAYEVLPLAKPPPGDAAPPPSEAWASAQVRGAKAERVAGKAAPKKQPPGSKPVPRRPKDVDLAHLSWMKKMDDESTATGWGASLAAVEEEVEKEREEEANALRREKEEEEEEAVPPLHSWMVLRGQDFSNIAKDVRGFSTLFTKCVSHSLGLSTNCVEFINVTPGVVVEYVIRPSGRNGDLRSLPELLQALDQQLGNPHSALRKGALGTYVDNAEVLAGEPKRAAAAPRGTRCDGEAQTDVAELLTPRLEKRRAGSKAPPSRKEAQEIDLVRRIREAVKELDAVRLRAERAEAATNAVLDEVHKRDLLIAEMSAAKT